MEKRIKANYTVDLMIHNGNIVDVFNIKKEDVCAKTIILGACRIKRFLGQTKYAYPVAAHLLCGYWYLKDIGATSLLQKQWLIHEAFESYTGVDLPSPLKAQFPEYKMAEKRALKVIAEAFGVNPIESDEIKSLDRSIMLEEALELTPNKEYWLEFAKEQNISRLTKGSCYVLNSELATNEEYLYLELSRVWEDVFGNNSSY